MDSTASSDPPAPVVVVVAYDQISLFHLAVPSMVFGAQPPDVPARFDLRVCAGETGALRTTAGIAVTAEHGLEALADAAIVIVPSWRNPDERPPQAMLQALRVAHRRGARMVGLCLGVYVLAEAGLLDGRRVTTHWAFAADFARRFPATDVDPEVLYVDDGDIVTSAGTAAGIDCCLHLLRQSFGVAIANLVARHLVVAPHRQGGQAQFIEQPVPAGTGGTRLAEVLDWVRSNLERAHDLDSLALRARMSRRTFTRQFRRLTGVPVVVWLTRERLACSQRLLETTDEPMERIAALAGFGSTVSLRQHFRASFGVSPSTWRQSFQAR